MNRNRNLMAVLLVMGFLSVAMGCKRKEHHSNVSFPDTSDSSLEDVIESGAEEPLKPHPDIALPDHAPTPSSEVKEQEPAPETPKDVDSPARSITNTGIATLFFNKDSQRAFSFSTGNYGFMTRGDDGYTNTANLYLDSPTHWTFGVESADSASIVALSSISDTVDFDSVHLSDGKLFWRDTEEEVRLDSINKVNTILFTPNARRSEYVIFGNIYVMRALYLARNEEIIAKLRVLPSAWESSVSIEWVILQRSPR